MRPSVRVCRGLPDPAVVCVVIVGVAFDCRARTGIPMGLSACVPLFLKEKVSLADIATFSLCSWPYSMKLLWVR